MKLTLFITLLIPLLTQAGTAKDCMKKITQAEKSECMAFIKDEAIGELVRDITIYCSKKDEIKDSEDGTLYPMLLDQCLEEKLKELNKIFNQSRD